MKNWIKVIFALNGKLDELTYSVDKQVDSLSLLVSVPTLELFENIISLNDKKVRLINLRVLHDKMYENLSRREYFLLKRLIKGASFYELATEFGLSKGHVYRIYMRIIKKLSKVLIGLGYDANRLYDEYCDMQLVMRTYKKLSRTKEQFSVEYKIAN